MKKNILIALAVTLLSGCSTVAAFYDSQDRCQSRGQANYQYPSYCGAGSYSNQNTVYTNSLGRTVGYGSRYPYRNN